MLTRIHSSRRRLPLRCGTAAVELAVVAPVIAILLVGLLIVGQMMQGSQILASAARQGARTAATGINSYSDVQNSISNYLTTAGINQTGLTVTIYNVTQNNAGPTFNPSTANWMDQLQITVTLPYSNIQLVPLGVPSSTVISAQVVWYSTQDQPYPVTVTPPAGN
jgi:Flp pilus assembly protein TadG